MQHDWGLSQTIRAQCQWHHAHSTCVTLLEPHQNADGAAPLKLRSHEQLPDASDAASGVGMTGSPFAGDAT